MYSTWRGDHPTEHELFEALSTEEGLRETFSRKAAELPPATEHNDRVHESGGGGM